MKKRRYKFIACFLVVIILMSFGVFAQSNPENALDNLLKSMAKFIESSYNLGIIPLAKFLIGSEAAANSKNFFSLILLFILLFSIMWVITEKIPLFSTNAWVQFVLSLVISLLAIRFIGEGKNFAWFQSIILPHQALGIAILSLLPLIFYIFFVQDIGEGKPILRKVMYIFIGLVFLFLYFSRYADLTDVNSFGTWYENPANIYFFAFMLSIALLFLDGTITKYWHKGKAEATLAAGHSRLARQLIREIDQLDQDYANNRINQDDYRRERNNLMQRLVQLRAGH